jgi:hypothetical protein
MLDNMEIVVIGTKHKPILTTEYLNNIEYRVFYTTDYDLPVDFKVHQSNLEYKNALSHMLGAYRCFRGHQDAMVGCNNDTILVFEDDAVPNREDWHKVVNVASKLLDKYEIVSLHCRHLNKYMFEKKIIDGISFLCKKPNTKVWTIGSLCYLIKKQTVNKICSYQFDGCPMDMFLNRYFSFCVVENSPFNHDRQHGSIVEKL